LSVIDIKDRIDPKKNDPSAKVYGVLRSIKQQQMDDFEIGRDEGRSATNMENPEWETTARTLV
jgi:hypothetical protein